MPTKAETLLGWGESGNRTAIAIWDNDDFMIAINDKTQHIIMPTAPTSLAHLVLTYNNGRIIAYVNGIKTELATNANVMTSQGSNLMLGTKYSASGEFGDIHLKSLRFYDGKVLTDEEALQNYNYETKINNYVREGLSMYIDAADVATYGSVRDISGKQNITNHGVSTTLDNNCLNFVDSEVDGESDYLDCGFKPNLTQWSAEVYFYFTTPRCLLSWGASGNRTSITVWDNDFVIAINNLKTYTIMPTIPTSLTHIILTYNNGTIIAYVNGVKSQLATGANIMSSQAGNLMVFTKYDASDEFSSAHLKSLRFYDGKVLTEEEALQNYNYEINRG